MSSNVLKIQLWCQNLDSCLATWPFDITAELIAICLKTSGATEIAFWTSPPLKKKEVIKTSIDYHFFSGFHAISKFTIYSRSSCFIISNYFFVAK